MGPGGALEQLPWEGTFYVNLTMEGKMEKFKLGDLCILVQPGC
jgi:hypothetical protein